jgi:hypothetical protein
MAYTKEFLDEMMNAQDVFVWEAPSWEDHDRGPRWHLWMFLVVIVLTGYAIFTANYLFAFIILLTAVILILADNPDPHPVLVQIGHNGIVYHGQLFQFNEIHDFSIIYHPPHVKVLYLQPKNLARPRLRISLEEEDPIAIRTHLKNYVDENLKLRDEHLSHIIARLLKL